MRHSLKLGWSFSSEHQARRPVHNAPNLLGHQTNCLKPRSTGSSPTHISKRKDYLSILGIRQPYCLYTCAKNASWLLRGENGQVYPYTYLSQIVSYPRSICMKVSARRQPCLPALMSQNLQLTVSAWKINLVDHPGTFVRKNKDRHAVKEN